MVEFICEPIEVDNGHKGMLKCSVCGKPFEYSRPAGQSGRRPKFCSAKCKREKNLANGKRYKEEGRYREYNDANRERRRLDAKRYWANKPKLQKSCLRCGDGFESTNKPTKYCPACVIAVLREAGIKNTLHKRRMATCEKCGDFFRTYRPGPAQRSGIGTWPPKLCGDCRDGSGDRPPKRRKGRIANAGRDRQKQQLYILERDDYRCHLCGGKAPKHLRGSTTNDRAPEVDHIVTADDKGTDDLTNLACSHRGCNRKKGRRSKGQLLMFG